MNVLKSAACAALLACSVALPSQAALIYDNVIQLNGTGYGNVGTVLTLQRNGTETGSVRWNGTQDVTTGNVVPGAAHNQTIAISSLAPVTAADLRIVLNANEPQNAIAKGINLTNLVLNIYSTAGALLWNSGVFAAQSFAETFAGTGNAGFAFKLDAAQAAAAQPFFATGTNRIGLAATLTTAHGGAETFFALSMATQTVPVPAPAGLAFLGLGLLGLAAVRRKSA